MVSRRANAWHSVTLWFFAVAILAAVSGLVCMGGATGDGLDPAELKEEQKNGGSSPAADGADAGESSGDSEQLKKPTVIRYGTQNYRRVMNQLRRGKKIRDINFHPEADARRDEMFKQQKPRDASSSSSSEGARMTMKDSRSGNSKSHSHSQQQEGGGRRPYATTRSESKGEGDL